MNMAQQVIATMTPIIVGVTVAWLVFRLLGAKPRHRWDRQRIRDGNDHTRIGWLARELLQSRTRMSRTSVKEAFASLAALGYELRVVRGKNKNGQPVYAYRGVQATYQLPKIAPEKGAGIPAPLEERGRDPDPFEGERGRDSGPKGPGFRPPSPHIPSQQITHSSARTRTRAESLLASAGADDDEIGILLNKIKSNGTIRDPNAYIRKMIKNGDIEAMLGEIRTETNSLSAFKDRIEGEPLCEHGEPGGHLTGPGGWVACALLRNSKARQQQNGHKGVYRNPTNPNYYDDWNPKKVYRNPTNQDEYHDWSKL
jgi:hypothetical protein